MKLENTNKELDTENEKLYNHIQGIKIKMEDIFEDYKYYKERYLNGEKIFKFNSYEELLKIKN